VHVWLWLAYYNHLIQAKQFSSLQLINDYSKVADCLFYSVQLLVVLSFFRPWNEALTTSRIRPSTDRTLFKDVTWGFLGGLLAGTIALPSLMNKGASSGLGSFFANHIYSLAGAVLLAVLIFVLPVASEGFFRGVLLRHLMVSMSAPAAVIVTALLFMLYWPIFSLPAGLSLGLVASILFWRVRRLLPCIVANVAFTVGALVLVTWRST
jgi:membrane protease YdiL (CAAX protease family)